MNELKDIKAVYLDQTVTINRKGLLSIEIELPGGATIQIEETRDGLVEIRKVGHPDDLGLHISPKSGNVILVS